MPRAPKVQQVQPAASHSDTKWFIIIGLLLALFAGSVILLCKSPQVRKIFVPFPSPVPEEAAAPEEAVAPAPEGLPEGGSVELVDVSDSEGNITDQKIVWRVESGDTILVESVNTLLPELTANREALFLFAKPTSDPRAYYAASCRECSPSPLHGLVAFDPQLRAFIPLLNAPDELDPAHLSPNQRTLAFGVGFENKEVSELWVYRLSKDSLSRVLTLPSTETLTKNLSDYGEVPVIDITWKDPTRISYKVFRTSDPYVSDIIAGRKDRQPIATRTVQIEQ